jgi:hypothetical protein
VETVVGMIKRRHGSATTGRTYWSRRRDLMVMVLTQNIMILLPLQLIQQIQVFKRPDLSPSLLPAISLTTFKPPPANLLPPHFH